MSRPRLFHADLAPGPATLSAAESRHVGSVLRGHAGDAVTLFDGAGREAPATLVHVGRDRVTVDVGAVAERRFAHRVRLTLAVALPRKHRQAYLFEKCTELGVWAIWPMVCARSVVRPKATQVERWRRTSIEAAKQCGRCWLPRIERPMVFDATLARAGDFDRAIVTDADTAAAAGPLSAVAASLHGDAAMTDRRAEAAEADNRTAVSPSMLVWIGPEGGLTPEESRAACAAGAVRAHLGGSVLRVETAAVAVAAVALLGSGS